MRCDESLMCGKLPNKKQRIIDTGPPVQKKYRSRSACVVHAG